MAAYVFGPSPYGQGHRPDRRRRRPGRGRLRGGQGALRRHPRLLHGRRGAGQQLERPPGEGDRAQPAARRQGAARRRAGCRSFAPSSSSRGPTRRGFSSAIERAAGSGPCATSSRCRASGQLPALDADPDRQPPGRPQGSAPPGAARPPHLRARRQPPVSLRGLRRRHRGGRRPSGSRRATRSGARTGPFSFARSRPSSSPRPRDRSPARSRSPSRAPPPATTRSPSR